MKQYITREQAVALANQIPYTDSTTTFYVQLCNAAIQAYRDSLVDGVVLPEPDGSATVIEGPLLHKGQKIGDITSEIDAWSEPLVRQAIADALANQQDHLQDIAAFIGVGGYNGATTEQLVERIKAEFQRLDNVLIKRACNPMFEFRECEDSQAITAPDPKDTDAKT